MSASSRCTTAVPLHTLCSEIEFTFFVLAIGVECRQQKFKFKILLSTVGLVRPHSMAFRVIPAEWAHTVDQRKERRLQRIWRTFKSSIDLRVCVSALETLLLCVQQTRFVDMRRRCSGRILGIET